MDAVVVIERATAILSAVPWMLIGLLVFGVVMVVGLLRFHRSDDNRYDLWDMVMSEGKADLNKHIVFSFAVLTIWTIMWMTTHDKNVETLLLGALGIFVASRAITSVTNTLKGVPKDEPMQDVVQPGDTGGKPRDVSQPPV